jgi:o-succinylbenzoate synthase
MIFTASYIKHILQFAKPARTSRGEMQTHTVYYICLQQDSKTGWGEAAPLIGLSIDDVKDFEEKLAHFCVLINEGIFPFDLDLKYFPSIRFALESALKELENESPHTLFHTPFIEGKGIAINGLVWMDSKEKMLKQAFEKIETGFTCIKFKIGALDFDEECKMLEAVRKRYSAFKVEIRLDANGAFKLDEAIHQLQELSRFEIHSIEQPIKPGKYDLMQEICAKSKIAVALDEELIGIDVSREGKRLLNHIRPSYLILKPTLIGGFIQSEEWIRLCNEKHIGWWATSALESNVGLNAIAQWVSSMQVKLPQGLGTGSLYTNNIDSPLVVKNGFLLYDVNKRWSQLISNPIY